MGTTVLLVLVAFLCIVGFSRGWSVRLQELCPSWALSFRSDGFNGNACGLGSRSAEGV